MLRPEKEELALVALQAERGRARARKRLTELLCSGKTMCEALEACAAESVSLGIHAIDIAEEERGRSRQNDSDYEGDASS